MNEKQKNTKLEFTENFMLRNSHFKHYLNYPMLMGKKKRLHFFFYRTQKILVPINVKHTEVKTTLWTSFLTHNQCKILELQ